MTGSGRTRISDIANRLGISTATVSRALSGNGYVRDNLANRIRATAIEMNYALPGNVSGKRALLVASQEAMIDFQRNQFTTYVLEGLRERAASQDITLDTHIFRAELGIEALREAAMAEDVVGLMLVTLDDATLNLVRALEVPTVLVNGDDPEMWLSSVTPCNRSAAMLATRHLMRLGHRRILFLNRPGRRTIRRRLEGWQDALGEACDPALVVDVDDWTAEAAQTRMEAVLRDGPDFTAVVAAGDVLATGAIVAVQAAGLSVPGDVSVVGIDGLPQGQYMSPALTSVRIPMEAVGALSLDLLVETARLRRARVSLPARRIELACEIVHRASAGPAP
ncbi:LacI family DNA-binding transcriptional regulator [Falsirhodobacter deserti]|uniref:LacI family DNA-binding transcriptional regulator n=1 Tax=Falsirhodobacter deserti TaxID=1365611 RepID=UPI000FE31E83|nr:LacI family DNA-binding transcriptional regulator [Falsirhodobacter deserti]